MRKTLVAWYDWFGGCFTSSTCATAAPVARMKKPAQTLGLFVWLWSRDAKGRAAAIAPAAIAAR